MKMVQFTRTMAPHNIGEERAVPDEVADRLVAENAATIIPSIFDKPQLAADTKRRRLSLSR